MKTFELNKENDDITRGHEFLLHVIMQIFRETLKFKTEEEVKEQLLNIFSQHFIEHHVKVIGFVNEKDFVIELGYNVNFEEHTPPKYKITICQQNGFFTAECER